MYTDFILNYIYRKLKSSFYEISLLYVCSVTKTLSMLNGHRLEFPIRQRIKGIVPIVHISKFESTHGFTEIKILSERKAVMCDILVFYTGLLKDIYYIT